MDGSVLATVCAVNHDCLCDCYISSVKTTGMNTVLSVHTVQSTVCLFVLSISDMFLTWNVSLQCLTFDALWQLGLGYMDQNFISRYKLALS